MRLPSRDEAPSIQQVRPGSFIQRLRTWLRSDMRVLRWIFLVLYLLLIVGLFGSALVEGSDDLIVFALICAGVFCVGQAMLILGSGTIQLCRPVRRRRLLLPVIAASFMLMLLFAGLGLALSELFKVNGSDALAILFWMALPISWAFWGILLFNYARHWPRYRVLSRFSTVLFAGSLAELLATVPSHLIVIRRPGCLVGLATMLGIIAGLSVMFFSLGPMIVVLFLRPRYREETALGTQFCEGCGYDLRASTGRCPECGRPFVAPAQTRDLDPRIA